MNTEINTLEETNQRLKEDLFRAYYDARKHKRNTINQLKFEINFEHELLLLYDEITQRIYKPKPAICFIVKNPVQREVFAADFRDRVIHHLLYNYISPVLERVFIEDSYSCRKEKGTLYGIKCVDQFIKECSENYTQDCYVLKLDIRGYFMNINKDILLAQLEELLDNDKIAAAYGNQPQPDWKLIFYLIKEIIYQDVKENCIIKGLRSDWDGLPPSKSLFQSATNKGLPIGNLTSQLFSNVYMHAFDNYITSELKIKYYGRYVDDFVLVDKNKDVLLKMIQLSKQFLKDKLCLEVHPNKIYLQHYTKGVAFLGAVIKPHRLYIGKRTIAHFKQAIRHYNQLFATQKEEVNMTDLQEMHTIINSYLGIMQHFKCYRIKQKLLLWQPTVFFKYGYFTNHLYTYRLTYKINRRNELDELFCAE